MSGGSGSEDYSQSTSEAAQQGGSIASPFSVGGGLKIPQWVWGVVLAIVGSLVAFYIWKKLTKKKK